MSIPDDDRELVRTRADLRFFLAADLAAQGLGLRWRWRYRIVQRVALHLWLLRRCEFWDLQRGPFARAMALLLLLRLHRLGERLGLDLPRHVFGPGLSIAHPGTIVVSPSARVGRNCRLHQGVTIGQVRNGFPVLGDDVWLASGAAVLGGVTLGDRVAVAANAVVVRDVPPGVTVGGVPARVISARGSQEWLRHGCALAGQPRRSDPRSTPSLVRPSTSSPAASRSSSRSGR